MEERIIMQIRMNLCCWKQNSIFQASPRYVLIDKTGKVSDENAPGPRRAAALKGKINDLLENSRN